MLPHKVLAAELPPILHDELIVEILSWLPVKSLMRFRCVCKSWKSLVSDPQFVKLHLHKSSAKNADFTHACLLFECNTDDSDETYEIPCDVSSFLENPSSLVARRHSIYELKYNYRAFGSCNGLISLLGSTSVTCWVRLWNPATRSRSQKSPCLDYNKIIPVHDRASFGFGYDYLSDTYKVVAVIYDPSDEQGQRHPGKVYSTGSNCWRNIQCFPALPYLELGQEDGVYLSGGTLNWVATFLEICAESKTKRFLIVSLDLGKETYTQLSMPYHPPLCVDKRHSFMPILGVLRDRLCVSYFDDNRTNFVLWQMEEFGVDKSWTRLVTISHEQLQREIHVLISLCMSENGDILMLSNILLSQAILYNPRDNALKCIEIPDDMYCYDAKNYIESLVSPY